MIKRPSRWGGGPLSILIGVNDDHGGDYNGEREGCFHDLYDFIQPQALKKLKKICFVIPPLLEHSVKCGALCYVSYLPKGYVVHNYSNPILVFQEMTKVT